MKFVHIAGDYATKDGVTFIFKNPSEVENKATIERLLKDPAFKVYHGIENPTVMSVPDDHACPKCGRIVRQGKYMHQKHCTG